MDLKAFLMAIGVALGIGGILIIGVAIMNPGEMYKAQSEAGVAIPQIFHDTLLFGINLTATAQYSIFGVVLIVIGFIIFWMAKERL